MAKIESMLKQAEEEETQETGKKVPRPWISLENGLQRPFN